MSTILAVMGDVKKDNLIIAIYVPIPSRNSTKKLEEMTSSMFRRIYPSVGDDAAIIVIGDKRKEAKVEMINPKFIKTLTEDMEVNEEIQAELDKLKKMADQFQESL